MNDALDPPITRRALLRHLAVAAGSAASLPLLGWPAQALADDTPASGTASKSALKYQDHPKGSSACANCANFLPGKGAQGPGRCIIVAGDISPKGWCLAYAGNG